MPHILAVERLSALCRVLYALCSMLYALCSMLYAQAWHTGSSVRCFGPGVGVYRSEPGHVEHMNSAPGESSNHWLDHGIAQGIVAHIEVVGRGSTPHNTSKGIDGLHKGQRESGSQGKIGIASMYSRRNEGCKCHQQMCCSHQL